MIMKMCHIHYVISYYIIKYFAWKDQRDELYFIFHKVVASAVMEQYAK